MVCIRTDSRRIVLVVLLNLVAVVTAVGVVGPSWSLATVPTVFHVTPDGAGARDGADWRSAGRLTDVPRFIERADPGDEVWIRGDLGPYETTGALQITAGGERGAPITVRGVDGAGTDRARPRLVGTRTAPFRTDGDPGGELFKLLGGADHLRFENMAFANQGNGVFRIGADIRDLTITDMSADNVRRFVENYVSGDERSATIRDLHIEDVRVRGFSKSAIRLRYATNNVVIRDVFGDSERQHGDNFAMGVHLDDNVHDVILDRVTMNNSHDSRGPGEYWNGDGFVTERGTHHITFRDTTANGSTDGGYDLKSTSTVLVRPMARGNKRNYRFWGQATMFSCVGRSPTNRGGSGGRSDVWVGTTARVRLIGCDFGGDAQTPVFDVDDSAQVTNIHEPEARVEPAVVASGARLRQTSLVDVACPTPSAPGYIDVVSEEHRQAIACVTERGVAKGVRPRTFAPDASVTRGQMASFIARLVDEAGGQLPATSSTAFSDTRGTTHADSIGRLAKAGLVDGFTDGTYRPISHVTRAQMATFLDRTYRYVVGRRLPAATFDAFDDDAGVHQNAINRLAQAGIALGGDSGRFGAARPVARAQMATFVARTLGSVDETTTRD